MVISLFSVSYAKYPCEQMNRYAKWTDGTKEDISGATWLRADDLLQDPEIDRPRQKGMESRAGSLEEDSEWTPGGRAPQSIWLKEEAWRLERRDLAGVILLSSSISSFHKYLWNICG